MDINSMSLINFKAKLLKFIDFKIKKSNLQSNLPYFEILRFYEGFSEKLKRMLEGDVPHLNQGKYQQELTRNIKNMAKFIFQFTLSKEMNLQKFFEEFIIYCLQTDANPKHMNLKSFQIQMENYNKNNMLSNTLLSFFAAVFE